jgi:hypothetical protein
MKAAWVLGAVVAGAGSLDRLSRCAPVPIYDNATCLALARRQPDRLKRAFAAPAGMIEIWEAR